MAGLPLLGSTRFDRLCRRSERLVMERTHRTDGLGSVVLREPGGSDSRPEVGTIV